MKKKKCKCYNCKSEGFNIDFIPFTTENKKVCYFCTDECKEYTMNTNYNQLQVYYLIIEVINSNVPKSTQTYILNQQQSLSILSHLEDLLIQTLNQKRLMRLRI